MTRYVCALLAAFVLCGCGDSGSREQPEGFRKTELTGYTLVRDVSAGEKLEMAMLKPGAMVTKTVESDILKELMLTSADIDDFLGKPFKKDVKKGDILEEELFQ